MREFRTSALYCQRGLLLLATFLVIACDRRNTPTPAPALGSRQKPSADEFLDSGGDLQDRVRKLETDLSVLAARVSQLESEDATVSTEQDVYGIARTKFGPFVVSSGGVTPYLDGFKVKLSIGNLTNATFHGTKLKVAWGPPVDFNSKEWLKAFKARKDRTFDLTTVLYPGLYSQTEVTLAPAIPEEIKSIEVGLELNLLSLRR